MTDVGLLAKKLAQIETCLRELNTLLEPKEIVEDLRAERFAEHTLQIAIQAALDVASHIVSDERLGEPRTNREIFEILARNGWLPASLVGALRQMVGFRNILVHGYEIVDPRIVKEVVETRLGDLQAFVDEIRRRLDGDASAATKVGRPDGRASDRTQPAEVDSDPGTRTART
jgi:uncharacterized protein YutE (UPF0331/DUF86 family)